MNYGEFMSVLDFETYKNKGKIAYVTGSKSVNKGANTDPNIEAQRDSEELDSIAAVMEMSTDELISELTVRNTTGHSIREVKTYHIVEELNQRMCAIEVLLMMYVADNLNSDD